MKKNSLIVFLFILFLAVFSFNNIYANTSSKEFVDIKVPAAVVIDYDTGRVLFEKNANDKRPMASLTKVMTSILLVENCESSPDKCCIWTWQHRRYCPRHRTSMRAIRH